MTIHSGGDVDGWTIDGKRYGRQSGGNNFELTFDQDWSFVSI